MRTQTVWVAVDGRQFANQTQCRDHEDRLFDVWLKEAGKEFAEFIKDEPRRREVVREFFEWKQGGANP